MTCTDTSSPTRRAAAAPASVAALTAPTSPRTITVTYPAPMYSLPTSVTFAAFTIASAASTDPIKPLVSIIPNASAAMAANSNRLREMRQLNYPDSAHALTHSRACLHHRSDRSHHTCQRARRLAAGKSPGAAPGDAPSAGPSAPRTAPPAARLYFPDGRLPRGALLVTPVRG